jgi:hypothetical protein
MPIGLTGGLAAKRRKSRKNARADFTRIVHRIPAGEFRPEVEADRWARCELTGFPNERAG